MLMIFQYIIFQWLYTVKTYTPTNYIWRTHHGFAYLFTLSCFVCWSIFSFFSPLNGCLIQVQPNISSIKRHQEYSELSLAYLSLIKVHKNDRDFGNYIRNIKEKINDIIKEIFGKVVPDKNDRNTDLIMTLTF